MSCCPKAPEISVGSSGDSNDISPSMEMGEGESADCFARRAGNSTGRLDDKTQDVPNTIENNDIPLIKGTDVNVKFRLTPSSTQTPTSWSINCTPPLPQDVKFNGDTLTGSFPKESYGVKFKLTVTAEPAINSRSFVFSPAKATGSNSISFIHPLPGAHVTSKFGYRIPPRAGASSSHGGVDFSVKPNPPADVLAAANGTVIFTGNYGGGGNTVIIQHLNASGQPLCTTLYMHLDSIYVAKDQIVVAGQKIGKEGNTGISTGAHLHFECRLPDQKKIDPLPFIKGTIGIATSVNDDNQADGAIENKTFNGSLTAENVAAKEAGCEAFGSNYPVSKGKSDNPVPNAPPGDPFEKAWFFTMYHEVGSHWTLDLPNQPDVAAGKVDTDQQKKNCGFVNKNGFPGGVTKFGIAQNPNPDLKVILIDYATAKKRGYNGYWIGMPATLVTNNKPKTAVMLFDICFLHGPGNGRAMAKRANIDSLTDDEAYIALSKEQRRFISSLSNADQYSGWFTRNSDLLTYVKNM